jgi:hypothetical protein
MREIETRCVVEPLDLFGPRPTHKMCDCRGESLSRDRSHLVEDAGIPVVIVKFQPLKGCDAGKWQLTTADDCSE